MIGLSEPRRLTHSDFVKQHVRFDPRGDRLVFSRTIGPRLTLMAIALAGGEEQTLFADRTDYIEQHPAWSPDRKQFSFTMDDGHRTGRVGVMRCDITDDETFANFEFWFSGNQYTYASWSPDGTRAVLVAQNYRMAIADADGKNLKILGPVEGIQGQPCWSPDGSRIAFSSSHAGNQDVYTIKPDGSELIRLTDSPRSDFRPVYAPGGNWIAFTSARTGNYEIFVMRPDGSEQQNLTNHEALDDHVAWNADGSQVAFISTRDGGYDVYVADVVV
ncbi:MAG: TolB family protein [Planctomycetaceae bacterium]